MLSFDGSLARSLDFDSPVTRTPLYHRENLSSSRSRQRFGLLQGPDKYTVLDKRRRAAQIKARHALGLMSLIERR